MSMYGRRSSFRKDRFNQETVWALNDYESGEGYRFRDNPSNYDDDELLAAWNSTQIMLDTARACIDYWNNLYTDRYFNPDDRYGDDYSEMYDDEDNWDHPDAQGTVEECLDTEAHALSIQDVLLREAESKGIDVYKRRNGMRKAEEYDDDVLSDASVEVIDAILNAAESSGSEDDKAAMLRSALSNMEPSVISYADALSIMYQAVEDMEDGATADDLVDAVGEAVDEHMTYRWGMYRRGRGRGRTRKSDLSEDEFEDATTATINAILDAAESPGDIDKKSDVLRDKLSRIVPTISYGDALGMLYQTVDDMEEGADMSSVYDSVGEGVEFQMQYLYGGNLHNSGRGLRKGRGRTRKAGEWEEDELYDAAADITSAIFDAADSPGSVEERGRLLRDKLNSIEPSIAYADAFGLLYDVISDMEEGAAMEDLFDAVGEAVEDQMMYRNG